MEIGFDIGDRADGIDMPLHKMAADKRISRRESSRLYAVLRDLGIEGGPG